MKSVLEATPPSFSADDVARIAAELFGLDGAVRDLGSERDQTFLAEGSSGSGVIKISNLGEQAATLDLEAEAILHIARVDPELPVARPQVVSDAEGASAYRTTVEGPDGTHFVRLFERLHGHGGDGDAAPDLSDAAVRAYGETHARLNLALRSFFHPAAGRELLWDLAHAASLRSLAGAIGDRDRRRLVEPEELELLGDLVATRLAAIVVISAWRVARYPENAEYIQAWDDDTWPLLELIGEIGGDRFAQELG